MCGFWEDGLTKRDSGAWLLLPTYMIYVMGGEILEGLALASEAGVKSE